MRIRLRIERNQKPPTQVLWPVNDISITVAQLLEQISAIHTLEGNTWGLEDYTFASGGYELMHFSALKDVLKDEDELVIKPYTWEERRARTALGRDQISADGRHLHDGIAFGKPFVRAATRPKIHIPPMKKRKLDHGRGERVSAAKADEIKEPRSEANVQDVLMNGVDDGLEDDDDEDDEEDDDEDADFLPGTSRGRGRQEQDNSDESVEKVSDISDDDSGTSDDEDTVSSSSEASSSSDSSSESSSDDEDVPDENEEWEGIEETSPTSATHPKTPPNGFKPALKKTVPEADTHSKATSKTQLPSNGGPRGIPNGGLAKTHTRNVRRREAKRLKYYKDQGLVPQDMTLAELRKLEDDGVDLKHGDWATKAPPAQVNGMSQVDANSNIDAAKAAIGETGKATATDGANDIEPARKHKATKVNITTDTDAKFEEERRKLLKAIQTGGVDVNGTEGPEENEDSPEETTSKDQAAVEGHSQFATTMVPPSVSAATRRSKLDLDGSKRLLFGHLGVRVPKTQEQKDALQKKLADKSKRTAVGRGNASDTNGVYEAEDSPKLHGEQSAPDTSESWRNKINLSAIECADEGVTLSEPPFPFLQGWDPQYNRRGKKRASSVPAQQAGKKRKRNGQYAPADEEYDKYNTDGYGDALNYDEEEEEEDVDEGDEYWEDGALLNGTGSDSSSPESEADDSEPDLPPLPSDLKTLRPLVDPSELCTGQIITYTELTCDSTTHWQPTSKRFTAEVLGSREDAAQKGEEEWMVRVAKRDLPLVERDEEGERVWGKFEMPQDEQDGCEERERRRAWWQMAEVRLVGWAG